MKQKNKQTNKSEFPLTFAALQCYYYYYYYCFYPSQLFLMSFTFFHQLKCFFVLCFFFLEFTVISLFIAMYATFVWIKDFKGSTSADQTLGMMNAAFA